MFLSNRMYKIWIKFGLIETVPHLTICLNEISSWVCPMSETVKCNRRGNHHSRYNFTWLQMQDIQTRTLLGVFQILLELNFLWIKEYWQPHSSNITHGFQSSEGHAPPVRFRETRNGTKVTKLMSPQVPVDLFTEHALIQIARHITTPEKKQSSVVHKKLNAVLQQ